MQADISSLLQPGRTAPTELEVFHDVELKSDAVGCDHLAHRGALFALNCHAASERQQRSTQEECRALLTGTHDHAGAGKDGGVSNETQSDNHNNIKNKENSRTSPDVHATSEGDAITTSVPSSVAVDATHPSHDPAAHSDAALSPAKESSSQSTPTCVFAWVTYSYLSTHLPHLMPSNDSRHTSQAKAVRAERTTSNSTLGSTAIGGRPLTEKQIAGLSKVAVWPDEKKLKESCPFPAVSAAGTLADDTKRAASPRTGTPTGDTWGTHHDGAQAGHGDIAPGAEGGNDAMKEELSVRTTARNVIVIPARDVLGVEVISSSVASAGANGRSATLVVVRCARHRVNSSRPAAGKDAWATQTPNHTAPGVTDAAEAMPGADAALINVVVTDADVQEHSFWFLRGGSVRFVKTIQAARPDLAAYDVQVELPPSSTSSSGLSSPIQSPVLAAAGARGVKADSQQKRNVAAAGASLGDVVFRIEDSKSPPTSSRRSAPPPSVKGIDGPRSPGMEQEHTNKQHNRAYNHTPMRTPDDQGVLPVTTNAAPDEHRLGEDVHDASKRVATSIATIATRGGRGSVGSGDANDDANGSVHANHDGLVRTWLQRLMPLTGLSFAAASTTSNSDYHPHPHGEENDAGAAHALPLQSPPHAVGAEQGMKKERDTTAAAGEVERGGAHAEPQSPPPSHISPQLDRGAHKSVGERVAAILSASSPSSSPHAGGSASLSSFSDLADETRAVMNPIPKMPGASDPNRPTVSGLTAEEWYACFLTEAPAKADGAAASSDRMGGSNTQKEGATPTGSTGDTMDYHDGKKEDIVHVIDQATPEGKAGIGNDRHDRNTTTASEETTPHRADFLPNPSRLLAARTKAFYGGLSSMDSATRLDVWLHCLGVYDAARTAAQRADVHEANTHLFDLLSAQWQSVLPLQEANFSRFAQQKRLVENDVVRTDRADDRFAAADSPKVAMMRQVLMAHVMLNFDMGYWQGMSDVCAVVVRQTEKPVMAFMCFSALLQQHLRGNFSAHPEHGMPSRLRQMQILMRHFSPMLFAHLRRLQAGDLSFCLRWLLMLFKREFAHEDTVRLWDVIITCPYTQNFEIFVAVGLLKALSTQIKENIHSHEALLRFINNLPHSNMSVQSVIYAAHDFYDEVCMEISLLPSVADDGTVSHVPIGATTSPRLMRRPSLQEVIHVLEKVDGHLPQ